MRACVWVCVRERLPVRDGGKIALVIDSRVKDVKLVPAGCFTGAAGCFTGAAGCFAGAAGCFAGAAGCFTV